MNLVLCIDQSNESIQAVKYMIDSGLLEHSALRLLHVSRNKDASSDIANKLQSIADQIRAACNVSQIDFVIASGDVVPEILEASAQMSADLIVVGSHGKQGLERFLLGSVSQSVLEQAQCPVLLARETPPNKNVLLCLDASSCSAAAVEWVADHKWAARMNLVVLAVVHPLPESFSAGTSVNAASEMLLEQQFEQALVYSVVDKWCKRLAAEVGREVIPYTIAEGDPKEVILQAANRWPAEMVILGSHGRTGLKKVLLGSVSQHVSIKAHCSVAIVRGRTAARYEHELLESESADLAELLSEKPHPAKSASTITGTDFNGYMPYL